MLTSHPNKSQQLSPFLTHPDAVKAACDFPSYYDGTWYHRGGGKDTNVQINPTEKKWVDNQGSYRTCIESYMHPKEEVSEGANYTMLLQS